MNRRNFLSVGSASAAFALLPAAKVTAAAVAYTPCSQLSELPAPPSPNTTRKLFPGFVAETVKTSGARINVLKGGDGPPLLLIHGHPEGSRRSPMGCACDLACEGHFSQRQGLGLWTPAS
jgi:hypothetical protein